MACNECEEYNTNEENCAQECGCDFEVDSACVRFTKKDLECLNIPKGTHLEDIIDAIDSKLCEVQDGDNGLSAYEIAVINGFSGTQEEWLLSLNGDDCDCEEQIFYKEDTSISTTGSWTDLENIGTISPAAVSGYSYTVPTGGAGSYEVNHQSMFVHSGADSSAGGAIEIFVNGSPLTNSLSATVSDRVGLINNLSLFMSNIVLSESDEIEIRFALSEPEISSIINSKTEIKKLA